MFKYLLVFLCIFCCTLWSFPVDSFDYYKPENTVSPISGAMGALNCTYEKDYMAVYYNPALLSVFEGAFVTASFRHYAPLDDYSVSLKNAKSFLKKDNLNYLALIQGKGAITYQPLVNRKSDVTDWENGSREYLDYALNCYQISTSAKENDFSFGINLRYISGRMIYLQEELADSVAVGNGSPDSLWITSQFINSKANGFSMDFGFLLNTENMKYGLTLHDILSKIYWSGQSNKHFKRRFTLGMQLETENNVTMCAMNQHLDFKGDPTYHFGYGRSIQLGDPAVSTGSVLFRLGVYSTDFKSEENIFFSVGSGFYWKGFRIDFSITSNDWNIDNNKYIASIAFGI